MATEFVVALPKQGYAPDMGWPCSALSIPGAKVTQIVIDGQTRDLTDFKISGIYIRKVNDNTPQAAAVTISLEKKLVRLDSAIVVALIGLAGTVSAAFLGNCGKSKPGPTLRIVPDEKTQVLLSPDETRSAVSAGECDRRLTYCVDAGAFGRIPLPRNGVVLGKTGLDSAASVALANNGATVSLADLKLLRRAPGSPTMDHTERPGKISCGAKDGEVLCTVNDI